MLKLALAALLLGAASAAPSPLCRVTATMVGIPFPPLRVITVTLRPECPPKGHAFVRLASTSGATDPVNSFAELTYNTPSMVYRGLLPNWHPEWEAESGITYRIPEMPSRAGVP